jgi:sugar lactone lactonase YvrE
MAGHHFSVQRIPRRFPRRIGPIAAAVALLGLAQPAWCIYNFTISNNTFPPTGTAPAVGSSVTQTVHVTLNGAGSVAIQSVVLQSAGWAGKEYTLGAITGCTVDPTGVKTNPSGTVCDIPVTFTPAYPGSLASPALSRNATLVVTDGNSNTWTFALTGAAAGPLAQMVPGTISRYAGQAYTGPGYGTLNPLDNGLGQTTAGYGGDGGPAASAQFNFNVNGFDLPQLMTFDSAGNLYVIDVNNYIIRKIDNTPNHNVTRIAGTQGTSGYSGDNGPATSATLDTAYAIALDAAGDIYFLDNAGYPGQPSGYPTIRRIDAVTGIITSVAGQNFTYPNYDAAGGGTCNLTSSADVWSCGDGGLATYADLFNVSNIAIDQAGNIYLWGATGSFIREITAADGKINTLASAAAFGAAVNSSCNPSGVPGMTLAADGNLYVEPPNCTANAATNRFITQYNLTTNPGQITNIASEIYQSNYCSPTSAQGGFPAADLDLGFGGDQSGALSSDASGNLYIPAVMEGSGCSGTTNPAYIYRINLNTSTAYLMEYNYGGTGTVTDASMAFNAFSGYYVHPIEVIPDASGNLYAMSMNQIAEISGSNAALYFPQANGSQADFTTSADQIVTYANLGNAGIPAPALSFASTSSSPGTNFDLDPSPTVPTPPGTAVSCSGAGTIAVGSACTLYLQFMPTQVGALTDTLDIGSPAAQTVSLSGNATGTPRIGVSPSSLSFGYVLENASASQYVTISNTGTATLTVSRVTDSNPFFFNVTAGGSSPCTITAGTINLAAGSSCTIQVTFTPTAATSYSADLSGTANTTASSSTLINLSAGQLIPFSGTGVATLPPPYGPPSSGATAGILFVPATLNLVAGLNGSGFAGDDGLANSSKTQLNYPVGMAYDSSGNLYIADESNYVVRRIEAADGTSSAGYITTVAGIGGSFSNTIPALTATTTATSISLGLLSGLVIDANNNIYVADRTNNVVWKIAAGSGVISVYAGGGPPCAAKTDSLGDGCAATAATLNNPWALGMDASDNLYIADTYNDLVREVNQTTGVITTFAGDIADAGGYGDCNSSPNLYSTNTPPYTALQAHLCFPSGIAFDSSGNAYITDTGNNIVRVVTKSTGDITSFAGTGTKGYAGDGGPAIDAKFDGPQGIYVDPANRVYISDVFNGEIRMVDSTLTINAVMSNTQNDLHKSSIGEPDTEAALDGAYGIGMDPSGDLVVSDSSADAITSSGSTGQYDFGSQQIYQTVTTATLNAQSPSSYPPNITISNPSGVTLTFTGTPTVTGPFAIAGGTCAFPGSVAPGASCSVIISFTPTLDQAYTGSIVINTNAIGSSSTINLSGTGTGTVSPSATLLPNPVPNFTSPTKVTSASQQVTLKNTGPIPITIGGTDFDGYSPTNFGLLSTTCPTAPATLAAGVSCYYYITFTPTAATTYSAGFQVDITTQSYGYLNVNLSGTGTAPAAPVASFMPNPLAFTNQVVNSTSLAQMVTVSNTGNAALTNIVPSITGSNAFAITTGANACTNATSLTGAETCNIYITFTPGSAASLQASLSVADNATPSPQTVTLSGAGVSFVSNVNTALPVQTVTVGITTGGTLKTIQALTMGTPNLDFTLASGGSCAAGTVNAGESCTVNVIFSPKYAGSRNGAILLTDANGVMLGITFLPGTGIGQEIAYNPAPAIAIAPTANSVALHSPWGVAVDGAGDLFIADSKNERVVEVPAGGGAATAIDPTVNSKGLFDPDGVAVDGAGNLFIADSGGNNNRVVEVPAGGGAPTAIDPTVNGLALRGPGGLAVDGAGDLFIADFFNNRVVEVPAGGGAPTAIAPTANGLALSWPYGVAVDGAGDLFIADQLNWRVVEVPAGGGAATAIDPIVNGSTLNSPGGVAVDGAGDLFIADQGNDRVVEVPAGGGAAIAIAPTVNSLGLANPYVVAVDGAGDLFIGDDLNSRVVEVQRPLPPALNFPTATTVGSTDTKDGRQTVQVFNDGNAALAFSALSYPADFSAASGDTSACTNSISLSAGQECDLPIQFTPRIAGTLNENVTLTTNALNAPDPTQSVVVSGTGVAASLTAQTITFGALANQVYGTAPFTVSASASSNLPVSFASTTASVCTVSGSTVTLAAVGTCTIQATQGGNANYAAAKPVNQSFQVTQAAQTITFGVLANQVYGTAPFTVSASASSNLPVSFASTTASVCTVSGSTVTLAAVGTCTIQATQGGNANNAAAKPVNQSFQVTQAAQTITFTQPTSPVTYSSGLTVALNATGGASGNPVVFTVDASSAGTGTISGSTLTVTGAGSIVIDANQAGNTNYSAAAQVQRSVQVNAPVPSFAVASPTPTQTVQPGGAATYTIKVNPVNGAYAGVVTLAASGLPTGATASFSPATVTPGATGASATLTIQTAAATTAAAATGTVWPLAAPALGLVGLFFVSGKRRRRWITAGVLLIGSLSAHTALAGCGGGFALPGAASQNYAITVTGTSGADVQTTTVQLTVQ